MQQRARRSAQTLGGTVSLRDLQARISQTSGHFCRSRVEAWGIRAQAIFLFLVSCYLVGAIYRNFDRNPDPVLKTIVVLVVIGIFVLSFVLFRHGNGSYSIRDGEICFERPTGKVRWKEQIADISGVGPSVDWFWEKWVVLKFDSRRRRLELLPTLVEALNRAVPPNKSLERAREG